MILFKVNIFKWLTFIVLIIKKIETAGLSKLSKSFNSNLVVGRFFSPLMVEAIRKYFGARSKELLLFFLGLDFKVFARE
jgi:hypothetical protein